MSYYQRLQLVLETAKILNTTEMIKTFHLQKLEKSYLSSSICHIKYVSYSKSDLSLQVLET